jgi:hypothetical protein
MIDNELRRTFAAHERLTPNAAVVAGRIANGIVRRRRRRQVTVVGLAALAALLVGLALPVALGRPSGRPVQPASPSAPADPTTVGGLVIPPPVSVTIPMTFGWLPPDVVSPTYTYTVADLHDGARTLTYEARPPDGGVESVSVMTRPTPSEQSTAPETGMPPWVSTHDDRSVTERGVQVRRLVTTSVSVGSRSCVLSWAERPDLWVVVTVMEKTRDTTITCDVGERVARELKAEPAELPRTASLGLVPVGFTLAQTGTNVELWCPASVTRAGPGSTGCIEVRDGLGYAPPATGERVTVRGHDAWIVRDDVLTEVHVPGYVELHLPASLPGDVDTSNAGIIRIAEAVVINRPW